MASITAFADGLAETLEREVGITRLAVMAFTSAPIFPCAFFYPPTVTPDDLGMYTIGLDGQFAVFVSAAMGENHKQLLEFQELDGPNSVHAAVRRNPDVGVTGVNVTVNSSRPLNLVEISTYNAYGCVFDYSAYIEGDFD